MDPRILRELGHPLPVERERGRERMSMFVRELEIMRILV